MKELGDRELGSSCSEGLLGAVEVGLSRCQLGLKRLDLSFQRFHALVILVASCGLPGCESDFTSYIGSLAAAFALNCGQRVAREGLVGWFRAAGFGSLRNCVDGHEPRG